jgi:hypothetical protein
VWASQSAFSKKRFSRLQAIAQGVCFVKIKGGGEDRKMSDGLPEKLLNSVEESRRSFLSKLILGTAFIVPGVASFSMSGLGIDEALAACGNQFSGNQFCGDPLQPPDAVRSLPGNYSGYDYSGQNFKKFESHQSLLHPHEVYRRKPV